MKTNYFICSAALLLLLTMSSFLRTPEESDITIIVQGAEDKDVIRDGLLPSELTYMTLESSDKTTEVAEFQIFLARGQSPVGFPATLVTGNQVALEKYRPLAKSGDRLVINLRKLKGDQKLPERKVILIPIR